MPYGYIVIFGAIAMTLYYVFASSASLVSKMVVLGVLGLCLACVCWLHRFGLAASFVMVGLAIYISIYRLIEQARSPGRRD